MPAVRVAKRAVAAPRQGGPLPQMSTHQRATMLLTCVGSFMVMLDVSIVNTALPSIQRSLHATFTQLQWVVDAYTLTFAVLLLPAGTLADRFGRRRVFQVGLVVFALGSLLCGLAWSSGALDGARVIQGIGGAALAPASMALLATAFPEPRQRVHAVSLWASFSAIGLGLGPTLGGALVEWIGWRWVFFINVPVGACCLIWGLRVLAESRDPAARRLDPLGLTTSVLWLGALTYGFIERGSHGWNSPQVAGPLAAAVVLLAAFLLVEVTVREPMLPLGLFRSRPFAVTAVVTLLQGGVSIATPFLTVQYLQNVQHHAPLPAGLRMLAFTAMLSIFAPVAGRLARRFGLRLPIALGALSAMVGFAFLSRIDAQTPYPDLAWRLFLIGAGLGLMISPLSAAALAGVPRERSGLAASVANTTRQIGVVIGIAVLGAMVQARAVVSATAGLRARGVPGAEGLAATLAHAGAQPPATGLPGAPAPVLRSIAAHAYVSGLGTAFEVAAAVMLGSLLLAATLLAEPRRSRQRP